MAQRSKLPVMQTAAASWRLLIAQWRFSLLLGLSLVAFILLALPLWHRLAAPVLSSAGLKPWMAEPGIAFIVGELILDAPLYLGLAVVLVPLHRRILTEEARRLPFRFGRQEAAYAGFLIVLEASLGVLTVALIDPILSIHLKLLNLGGDGVIPDIAAHIGAQALIIGLVILAATPLIYVYVRLSLALPGVAIGTPSAIARGWRAGRGNGWRLVAVSTLVFLPALVLIGMLDGIWALDGDAGLDGPILIDPQMAPESAWPVPFAAPSAAMVFEALFHALLALPEAAALSLAYKRLDGVRTAAIEDVFS